MKEIKIGMTLILLVCMFISLSVPAGADMWFPPDEEANTAIVFSMVYSGGSCGGINAFLSNYVEANVTYFDSTTSEATAMAKTLKHLELNASLFGDKVSRFLGEDGRSYMRVSGDLFEERVRLLFDRYVDASEHAGYCEGDVIVSSEDYGGPIQVFASAYDVEYYGNRSYYVYFDVFKVTGTLNNWYSTANVDLPRDQLKHLGTGTAKIYYNGDNEAYEFYSTDFTLQFIKIDAEDIPCTSVNMPYITEEATILETGAPTEAPQPETEMLSEPLMTKPVHPEVTAATEPTQASGSVPVNRNIGSIRTILVVLLVIAVSLLAFLLVLLLYRKKQH